jgi:hypothetical protein
MAASGVMPKYTACSRDAVCVNSLFFWRVHKVEPKDHLFFVRQNDVESVSIIPALWLVDAAVETLKRLSGWGRLRKCKQRRQSNQRRKGGQRGRRLLSVLRHIKKRNTISGGSETFGRVVRARRGSETIPLPKSRIIRHNSG